MKLKKFVFLMVVVLTVFTVAGCGKSSTEVPDELLDMYALSGEFYEDYYRDGMECTWVASHNPSKESHLDKVDLVVTLKGDYGQMYSLIKLTYQYNKSSDLWSLVDESEWTEPTFHFNKNLVGNWHVDDFDNSYDISIESFKDDYIELSCNIKEEVNSYLYSGLYYTTYEEARVYYEGGEYISIPIHVEPPFSGGTSPELTIRFDILNGVDRAFIFNNIYYVE